MRRGGGRPPTAVIIERSAPRAEGEEKSPGEPRADRRSADGSRREHSPALRAETSLTGQSLIGAGLPLHIKRFIENDSKFAYNPPPLPPIPKDSIKLHPDFILINDVCTHHRVPESTKVGDQSQVYIAVGPNIYQKVRPYSKDRCNICDKSIKSGAEEDIEKLKKYELICRVHFYIFIMSVAFGGCISFILLSAH